MNHGVVALILLCPLFFAEDQGGSQSLAQERSGDAPAPIFRAETNLALVSFQVLARKNDFVTDLRPDEIKLLEDGVPQKLALFEGGKLYPRGSLMEVHVMFDASASIRNMRNDPRAFDANLLDEFPNVHVGIWGFSGPKLSCFAAPTRDSAVLKEAMGKVRGMEPGSTPIYSSVVAAARSLAASPGEFVRFIVVISDGKSTSERATQDDAVRAAQGAGIPIYPVYIGISSRPDMKQSLFVQLGELTGGRGFEFWGILNEDPLEVVLKRLAEQIRYGYTAGYYPALTGASGSHKVEVVLSSPTRGKVVGGVRSVKH